MTLLDDCWHLTAKLLTDRGMTRDDLDPATGSGGQLLTATRWTGADAEARVVTIRGTAAGVFHSLLVPHDPGRAPVLVAEVLFTGGKLRLAFLDVQTPGMSDTRPVRDAAKMTAARYTAHFHPEPAPEWATEYASGHQAYVRPAGQEVLPMTEMYSDYLALWHGLTPTALTPAASPELTAFKQRHRTDAPVAGYLSRVFGDAWTTLFLDSFLYR